MSSADFLELLSEIELIDDWLFLLYIRGGDIAFDLMMHDLQKDTDAACCGGGFFEYPDEVLEGPAPDANGVPLLHRKPLFDNSFPTHSIKYQIQHAIWKSIRFLTIA